MNKNKMKNRHAGGSTPTVNLEFIHPSATTVCVAGSFNDWRTEATPMIPLGGGRWRKELTLPPGTFEYCLVVDGVWMPDPSAIERVPNPYGGQNSVLKVLAPAGCFPSEIADPGPLPDSPVTSSHSSPPRLDEKAMQLPLPAGALPPATAQRDTPR